MSRTKLILLGTGTPSLEVGTTQTASALIVDDTPYLIDCGSGVVQRLAQARAKGLMPLEHNKLTKLFITHLHPDHTLGLADVMVAEWNIGRNVALDIFGVAGTDAMVDALLQAYQVGIEQHRTGGPHKRPHLRVTVTEYQAGIIYRDDLVEVEAFAVDHAGLDTFGLKFTTPDKVVVFSSDTCPLPIVAEKATGCDILVHEAVCETGLDKMPAMWQEYMLRVHSSAVELGKIAQQAQPGLLVLHHQLLFGGATAADMVEEIGRNFSGSVAFGRDLDVFE